MCDTPNRPVKNATLLPTGHWGMAAFDSNMWHVKHIEHWKPCLGVLMCHLGTNNRLLIYALCVILPTGQWRTPHYSQPATEEWLHFTAIWGTWNTSNTENHVWGAWCHSGTSNPLFIHALCVIIPTGQWGTLHYSQPATEECLYWLQYGARETHWTLTTMSGGPDVLFRDK